MSLSPDILKQISDNQRIGPRSSSIFGEQLTRFLRSSWLGPFGAKGLSEEIYSTLRTDMPLTVSRINIVNTPEDLLPQRNRQNLAFPTNYPPGLTNNRRPAIQFSQPASQDPGQQDPNQQRKPPVQISTDDGFGNKTTYQFTPDGLQPVNPVTQQPQATQVNVSGGGIPAQITGGSGSSPTILLYEGGVAAGATQSVTATVLQIATGESFPSGTWCFASQVGGTWYVQPPVWL